jgi:hypothetical protein
MRTVIKPGIKLIDMCETLENTVRRLIGESGLDAGEPGVARWAGIPVPCGRASGLNPAIDECT